MATQSKFDPCWFSSQYLYVSSGDFIWSWTIDIWRSSIQHQHGGLPRGCFGTYNYTYNKSNITLWSQGAHRSVILGTDTGTYLSHDRSLFFLNHATKLRTQLTRLLTGNYGVPSAEQDSLNLPIHFESAKIHVDIYAPKVCTSTYLIIWKISGLIVCDYSTSYSHWNSFESLSSWLKSYGYTCFYSVAPMIYLCTGIPALYGIDTRSLTKKLRDFGDCIGKIEFKDQYVAFEGAFSMVFFRIHFTVAFVRSK